MRSARYPMLAAVVAALVYVVLHPLSWHKLAPSENIVIAVAPANQIDVNQANANKQGVSGATPQQIRWFTPPYYKDGRQRATLFGDSTRDGLWVDRVKIPGGGRVRAHTHPHDELVTVIEGTWFVGEGTKFDETRLRAYPAGSFVVIPAGVPHFTAAQNGPVIIQASGTSKFQTDMLEK